MSIHSPERQPGETQKDYRERMAKAKGIAFMKRRAPNPGHNPQRNAERQKLRAAKRARVSAAQCPKFPTERVRKQHKHPLQDAHGAYVLVGPEYEVYGVRPDERREHVIGAGKESDGTVFYSARRKWLAGVSAQRGY